MSLLKSIKWRIIELLAGKDTVILNARFVVKNVESPHNEMKFATRGWGNFKNMEWDFKDCSHTEVCLTNKLPEKRRGTKD